MITRIFCTVLICFASVIACAQYSDEASDRDGDGVPDKDDVCPTTFGSKNNKGCPDSKAEQKLVEIPTAKYDHAYALKDGLFGIKKDTKQGLMNKEGKVLLEPLYDDITFFADGLAAVSIDKKYGYINKSGKLVIPCQFDYAYSFKDGIALVELKDKNRGLVRGCINKTGEIVIPLQYGGGGLFNEGLTALQNNTIYSNKYIFLDRNGKQVIADEYKVARNFSEGLAAVGKEYGKMGAINKKGDLVVPFMYNYLTDFKDGFAKVEIKNKYGFVDKNGIEVVPIIYDNASSFSDGLASVTKDGKKGFVDNKGKVVIPFIYDNDYSFHDGVALVSMDKKWGIINKSGEVLVPFNYDAIGYATADGKTFMVEQNKKWGIIDKKNKVMLPIVYDKINMFRDQDYASVKQNSKYGYINKKGEIVVPIVYDVATEFNSGYAYVSNENESGLIRLPKVK